MESFFHETCFSNADNRVLDVLRTSVKHRPERSADVEARSAERSGYNYSLKHNRKDIQIWRARLNQSKPLTRTGFGR